MDARYWVAEGLCLDHKDARVLVDGVPVKLGARAFDLLTVLMERPRVLLTKDELFARVWTGVTVSDAVLTTAMKELRQAIGDSARAPRFVETAHGRGYRFLLPVERTDTLVRPVTAPERAKPGRQAPNPASGAWLWRGGMAVVCGLALLLGGFAWMRFEQARSPELSPHPKSIVVLPFEDLSPDGDQRWFADGLAEEVQTTLAKTPDLRIGSRMSAARMVHEGVSGQQAADRLGSAQFLEGSIRRAGDRVRVTVRLIRTADGLQLWSHNYDRDVRDVISIQEDIAFQIASALKTVMDPDRLRIMVASGTSSVEAYEAYLRGLALDQRQFETGDLSYAVQAADSYERARVLDPQFAAAHWKAARSWYGNQTRIDSGIHASVPDAVRQQRYFERVDAAIAVSSDDTERLKYEAGRASMAMQIRTAHRLMARYLAARPRDIDAWEQMADLSAYFGDRKWMRRAAERIHTLSVQEGDPRSRAITVSVMAMDLDAAVSRARVQLALRPDNAVTQYQAHRALIWSGRFADARALAPAIRNSRLPAGSRLIADLRQACAERRFDEARRIRAVIDAEGNLNNRWIAAQTAGDLAGATAMLRPLDTPERLPALMQYLVHPTFDARSYPLLMERLRSTGASVRTPVAMPYACPTITRAN